MAQPERPALNVPRDRVPVREILRFYLPLVLTSQMMTLSGPIINMGIGRSADPTLNFAGYWLGFAILLFLQSPTMVIQQITATLVDGHRSVLRLLLASTVLGLIAAAAILIVAWTPIGSSLIGSLIPTTPRVASLARSVLAIFSPIPILIAIRGVANGLAIREKRTALIARATFVRLIILSAIVGLVVLMRTGSGARAGAWALLAGISAETLLVVLATWRHGSMRGREGTIGKPALPYATILRVAAPLFVSAAVWTLARPVINAILGLLPNPEAAQAGFGVILPLVLVTCSPLWAIQNVSLVLPENRAQLASLVRFALATAVLFSGAILILALTPLRHLVLRNLFDLTAELEREVAPALYLIILEPLFLGARSFAQGLLMRAQRTEAFLIFSPLKIALIAGIGFPIAILRPEVNGTFLGTALFLGGDLLDGLAYGWKARSFVRSGVLFPRGEARPDVTVDGV